LGLKGKKRRGQDSDFFGLASEHQNTFPFSKPSVLQHLFPFNHNSHCFFVHDRCYYFIRSDPQYSFKTILL